MSKVGRTTVTAVDRKAGTITVSSWTPDTLFMHPEVYAALRAEITTFSVGECKYVFRAGDYSRDYERADDQMLALLRPRPITPAVVVTLATLGAFEWLRHRKAEVAAAEASGDYTTLVQEFVTWLRALLAAWRKAAQ